MLGIDGVDEEDEAEAINEVMDIDENNKRDMIVQATVDQQLVNINELKV